MKDKIKEQIILEYPDRWFGASLLLSYFMIYGLGKVNVSQEGGKVALLIMVLILVPCMIKIYYKLGIFKKEKSQ